MLFNKSKRKNITVRKALEDDRWISHITPLVTTQEIREYVTLWEEVGQIQLQESVEDNIHLRWTADGEYTTKSAYCIQFQGTFSKLKLTPILKAKAEPKCRFFAWTLLHKKILTANNLIKRNWPNDPICKLCGIDLETPTHLCKDCNFARQVWSIIKQWLGLSVIDSVAMAGSLHAYWRKCRAKINRDQRRMFDGYIIYFWWNLWKERNRRTFQNKSMQPRQVALLCKEDIEQFQLATRPNANTQ
jgi:hypothetical protein